MKKENGYVRVYGLISMVVGGRGGVGWGGVGWGGGGGVRSFSLWLNILS